MEEIRILTPQFERLEELEYKWKPETEQQFYNVINNAPIEILKGLGFGKWDTMNNLIKENMNKPKNNIVEIPIINANDIPEEERPEYPNGCLCINTGQKNGCPDELLEYDEDVWLFPGEWYDIIPDGFLGTGLWGESDIFIKGVSDDDIRFGCLAFGIRRRQEKLPDMK